MAEQSTASETLWLLDSLADFQGYSLELVKQTNRHIAILSHQLDDLVYGTEDFVQALSNFARSSRHCEVRLLIKDTQPAIESGHLLIRLAQRLPSKILIRRMTQEPANKAMGFMLGDTSKLLYKNDESAYRGFYNQAAFPEVKQLQEEFNYLWHYAEAEPEFQRLHL
jgi:hypothetical protein